MKAYARRRKETALKILENQLVRGNKPVKGPKPVATNDKGETIYQVTTDPKTKEERFVLDRNGNKKPLLLDNVPLTDSDRKRIEKEILSLKTKLKLV